MTNRTKGGLLALVVFAFIIIYSVLLLVAKPAAVELPPRHSTPLNLQLDSKDFSGR